MTTPRPVDDDMLQRILGRTRSARQAPPVSSRVLVWYDHTRKRDRVLRWQGPCLSCARQTWAFDDGENDPRGVLGDAALWTVPLDVPEPQPEVRACSMCANDYDSYRKIQAEGLRLGVEASLPYGREVPA